MTRRIRASNRGDCAYCGFDTDGNFLPRLRAYDPYDDITGRFIPYEHQTRQDGYLKDVRSSRGSYEKNWPPVENYIFGLYDLSLGIQSVPAGSVPRTED